MLTTEELIALRDAATQASWEVLDLTDWIMAGGMHVAQVRGWGWLTGLGGDGPRLTGNEATLVQKANASLIALVPDLLDEVIRLRAREAAGVKLAEAVSSIANFMPDERDHPLAVIMQMAGIARRASEAWEAAQCPPKP